MVINEKALVKAMKAAYKGDGYVVGCQGDELFVESAMWKVVADLKNFPRKALGLIAEHMGQIPTDGMVYQIREDEAQTKITEKGADFRGISDDEELEEIYKTRLTYGAGNIWQMAIGGRLLWVMPENENLMQNSERAPAGAVNALASAVAGKALRIKGMVSSVTVMATEPLYQEKEILDKLSKIGFIP